MILRAKPNLRAKPYSIENFELIKKSMGTLKVKIPVQKLFYLAHYIIYNMKGQATNAGISKTEKTLQESMRRLSVAELHRSGTEIRKAELERIALGASILKSIAEGHYNSLVGPDGIKSPMEDFTKLIKAEKDEEIIESLANLIIDVPQHMGAMDQIEQLLQSVNKLIDKLKGEGVYFEFPKFTLVGVPTRDMAKLQLSGAIGFLDGIISAIGENKK